MGREIGFLDFNIRNILTNLHQAEDHYRNLSEDSDELGHKSCITKHIMMSSGEAGEGISHASVVRPELVERFKEIKESSDKFISDMGEIGNQDGIKRVRKIRKMAEKLDPNYDTSRCKACGDFEEKLSNYEKPLNRESDKNLISIQTKEIHMDNTMQNLAGSFVGKGISEVTSRMVSGSSFGIANKSLLNLGIGLAIDLVALRDAKKQKKLLGKKMEVPLVSAANFLIADEVGDLIAGYIPSGATARVVAARATPSVSVSTNGGIPQYSNGKHIFVD